MNIRDEIVYELHVRGHCGWCKKAIKLCTEKNLNYLIVDYDNCQQEVLNEVKELHKWKTVPIIIEVNLDSGSRELVGGFSDFEQYMTQDKNETRI